MTNPDKSAPKVFTFMSEEIAEARHRKPGRNGTDVHLPGTNDLTGRIKVYVSGGENHMHSHPREDHVFYVLAGTATFHIERDDNTAEVNANSGVLLPRGTKYWFTNTGEGNLVMLRVGSSAKEAFVRKDGNNKEIETLNDFPHIEGRVLV